MYELPDEAFLLFSLSLPAFLKGSPPPGNNLLLKEQILSLKSGPHSKSCILQRRKHEFMLFIFVKLMKKWTLVSQYSIISAKVTGALFVKAGAFIRINMVHV